MSIIKKIYNHCRDNINDILILCLGITVLIFIRQYMADNNINFINGILSGLWILFFALLGLAINLSIVYLFVWIYMHMRRMGRTREWFTSHLCSMLKMDITLPEALSLQKGLPRGLRRIMRKTHAEVSEGTPLSAALEDRFAAIPPWYVAMIKIGEGNGTLPEMLGQIQVADSHNEDTRMRIVDSLLYPFVVVSWAGLVGFMSVLFIIPKYKKMFTHMGAFTGFIDMHLQIATYTMLAVAFMATLLGLFIFLLMPMPYGRNWEGTHPWIYRVVYVIRDYTPFFGRRYRESAMARWSTTLATLLEAGLPMHKALAEAATVEPAPSFRKQAFQWAEKVEAGHSLSAALASTPAGRKSKSLAWQIRLTEGSQSLIRSLRESGANISHTLRHEMHSFMTLIPPVIIILLGLGVAEVCIALFTPIIAIMESMAG